MSYSISTPVTCYSADLLEFEIMNIAMLLAFGVAAAAPADERSLEVRVREEMANSLSRLEGQLSQSRGSAKLRTYNPKKNAENDEQPVLVSIDNVSYCFNGQLRKMSLSRMTDADRAEISNPRPRGRTDELVECIGKTYSFYLRRENGGPFVLKTLTKGPFGAEDMDHLLTRFLFAPSRGFLGTPSLSQIMRDSNFKMRDVSKLKQGDRDCVSIQYDYDGGSNNILRSGSVVVCPAEAWAIQSHESDVYVRNSKRHVSCRIEYAGQHKGIPIPARVVALSPFGTRWVFDFQSFVPGPAPEKEFTLAAYGLPEIDRPVVKRDHSIYYWLLGGAALALTMALAARYASKRLRVA